MDVQGLVDMFSDGVMLFTNDGSPRECLAVKKFVERLPFDALPDDTKFNKRFFDHVVILSNVLLRPFLEIGLLYEAAGPTDDQIPAIVFHTPLAACRVMKHIATRDNLPSQDEMRTYGAMFATTDHPEFIADVKEGALRRGVPTSDFLGSIVFMPPPGCEGTSHLMWPLDSWREFRDSSASDESV